METPIIFIIFKRPETTQKVFEAIRQARPKKLFVIADGPRVDRLGEAEKCSKTRMILDQVDWDCEVIKDFSQENLGCEARVISGLDWVFSLVEQAIVLEDDCLPHPTFFQFCDELLNKYKDDERIMTICGTNVLGQWKPHLQSYHLSLYGKGWGWASWRRAWKHFDVSMKNWPHPEMKQRIKDILCDEEQYRVRCRRFDDAYIGKPNVGWDAQWLFARLSQSGMSIVPSQNLVSNIGFGEDATHTKVISSDLLIPTYSISFPLKEPVGLTVDREYDQRLYQNTMKGWSLLRRVNNKIKSFISPKK